MKYRAIVREYFPQDELWRITKEVPIFDETEHSVKVKMAWWKKPEWFSKNAIGIKFEKYVVGLSTTCSFHRRGAEKEIRK